MPIAIHFLLTSPQCHLWSFDIIFGLSMFWYFTVIIPPDGGFGMLLSITFTITGIKIGMFNILSNQQSQHP